MLPRGRDDQAQAALIEGARAGSADALASLYHRHADVVFTVALRLLGSRPDAEDVLQDVFTGLPEALAGYTERGRFDAWLRRVAVRTTLMALRRRRQRRRWTAPDVDVAAPTGPDLLDRLSVQRALARLPGTLRVVFVLKEIEGYTHREIAEQLGITATASALRNHRAWKNLRKTLEIP